MAARYLPAFLAIHRHVTYAYPESSAADSQLDRRHGQCHPLSFQLNIPVIAVMKIGNITPRVGWELTYIGFRGSQPTETAFMIPDVTALPVYASR